MNDKIDSESMPLDGGMTTGERRDAQVRMLENLAELLSAQMAELAIGQDASAKRAAAHDLRLVGLEKGLAENTEVTHEVRDLLTAFRGGFRVLGWLGVGLKWAGGIASACAAIYTVGYMLTHGGSLPPPPMGDK